MWQSKAQTLWKRRTSDVFESLALFPALEVALKAFGRAPNFLMLQSCSCTEHKHYVSMLVHHPVDNHMLVNRRELLFLSQYCLMNAPSCTPQQHLPSAAVLSNEAQECPHGKSDVKPSDPSWRFSAVSFRLSEHIQLFLTLRTCLCDRTENFEGS